MPTTRPFVSIVMPALNEEPYIEAAIRSILPASGDLDYELLVLDGGSADRTRDIVLSLAEREPRIKLLHNERRIQSAAVNLAAKLGDARAGIIVRADCHAHYPRDFVARCVGTLQRAQSTSVVVPMQAVGRGALQRAIAAAQNSRLGNGGSAHRRAGTSGYVDHGHHAAFDRAAFLAIGGYDETAPFNEDAEFDMRLRAAGGRIYLDGTLGIDYYPRTSFRALALQYFRHGWGRANTLIKHARMPRIRQVLPVVVLLAAIGGFLVLPIMGTISLLPIGLYMMLCLAWGAALAWRAADPAVLLAGPAAMIMHLSWGAGFLVRLAERYVPGFGPRFRRSRSFSFLIPGVSDEGRA